MIFFYQHSPVIVFVFTTLTLSLHFLLFIYNSRDTSALTSWCMRRSGMLETCCIAVYTVAADPGLFSAHSYNKYSHFSLILISSYSHCTIWEAFSTVYCALWAIAGGACLRHNFFCSTVGMFEGPILYSAYFVTLVTGRGLERCMRWHHWTRWARTVACLWSPSLSINLQIYKHQTNQKILIHEVGRLHQVKPLRDKQT